MFVCVGACMRACRLYCLCSTGSDGEPSLSPRLTVKWVLGRTPSPRVVMYLTSCSCQCMCLCEVPRKGAFTHTHTHTFFAVQMAPASGFSGGWWLGCDASMRQSDGHSAFSGQTLPLHRFYLHPVNLVCKRLKISLKTVQKHVQTNYLYKAVQAWIKTGFNLLEACITIVCRHAPNMFSLCLASASLRPPLNLIMVVSKCVTNAPTWRSLCMCSFIAWYYIVHSTQPTIVSRELLSSSTTFFYFRHQNYYTLRNTFCGRLMDTWLEATILPP